MVIMKLMVRMEMEMKRSRARHFPVTASPSGGGNSVAGLGLSLGGSGRSLLVAGSGRVQQKSWACGVLRVLHVRIAVLVSRVGAAVEVGGGGGGSTIPALKLSCSVGSLLHPGLTLN